MNRLIAAVFVFAFAVSGAFAQIVTIQGSDQINASRAKINANFTYLDGKVGPTGATGSNGTNGTNGTNGVAGATGPTGATGSNGTNGTPAGSVNQIQINNNGVLGASTCTSISGGISCPGAISSGVGGTAGGLDALGILGTRDLSTAAANSVGLVAPLTGTGRHIWEMQGSSAVAHSVFIFGAEASGVAAMANKAIPDCQDTGGNHLNFTQSSDTFNCGTSGATSGGGATPVAMSWAPFGSAVTTNATSVLGATNQTRFIEVVIPYPGALVSALTIFTYDGGSDAGHYAYAWYDSSCNLLGASSTITGAGAQSKKTFTFSALSVAAGKAFLAFSSDSTATKFFAAATDGGYVGYLVNDTESAGNYHLFTGTASTTVANVITFPASCGTRSALSAGGSVYLPGIHVH